MDIQRPALTIYIFKHVRTGGIIESTQPDWHKKYTGYIKIGERTA